MTRTYAGAAAAAAVLALLAGRAEAHAHLVTSSPAAGATVPAPRKIELTFSERLEPKFSGAALSKAGGAPAPATAKVAGKSIVATPSAPLAPGAYQVKWRVVSADGHRVTGGYAFTVR